MFRILDNEAVILNLGTGVYFGLDSIGTRAWQLLSEHGSMDKVIEIMLGEYSIHEEQLRQDLDRLVEQLSQRGLLKHDT